MSSYLQRSMNSGEWLGWGFQWERKQTQPVSQGSGVISKKSAIENNIFHSFAAKRNSRESALVG